MKPKLLATLMAVLLLASGAFAQNARPQATPPVNQPTCDTKLVWPAYQLPAPNQLVTFDELTNSAFKSLSGVNKSISLKQIKQNANTSYCNDRTKWKSCAGLALRLSQTNFTKPDDAKVAHDIYKKAEEVTRDYFEHAFDRKLGQSITSLGTNLDLPRAVLIGRQLGRLREDDPDKKFQRQWALRAAEVHALGRNFFGRTLDTRPRYDLSAEVYESINEKELAQTMWLHAAKRADDLYQSGSNGCNAGSAQIVPYRTKFYKKSGSQTIPPLPNVSGTVAKK